MKHGVEMMNFNREFSPTWINYRYKRIMKLTRVILNLIYKISNTRFISWIYYLFYWNEISKRKDSSQIFENIRINNQNNSYLKERIEIEID